MARLKDRDEVKGFIVLNEKRTRQITPINCDGHTGIITHVEAGFFLDQSGQLYAVDCYDRIFPVQQDYIAVEL